MRNKTIAALLAFFVGWLGIHKFYLGQNFAGILYLLFSWTFIPGLFAFFEFLGLVFMSEQAFNAKFNGTAVAGASFPNIVIPNFNTESSKDKTATLLELKKLYDSGVITAEEYEVKRRKILDSI